MDADVLVGADGIWSNVRAQMYNEQAKGPGSGTTYSGVSGVRAGRGRASE